MRLSEEAFAEVVDEALQDIPEAFKPTLANVVIDVEPMPDRETCRAIGIRNPRALLGLYRGTPLTKRSVEHIAQLPDHITIYQRNIERVCRTRRRMIEQIRRTVFHEVGHHFGMNEQQLRELGY